MKKIIKLTENDLHNLIKQTLKNTFNESILNNEDYTEKEETTEENKQHISEKQFRKIVKENVLKILNESIWYGDTKPLETIMQMTEEIMSNYNYINEPDYEDVSDDNNDMNAQLYEWAKKVNKEAEEWLQINSSYSSNNGGEDW